MKNIKRFSSIGLPAVLGIGVAWLGLTFIKSEKSLENRRMELEIQLNAKSIRVI
tara:strand:+ start:765 stop:926 length:162 start_codon:yes stop_codon:yes gene_type:complete